MNAVFFHDDLLDGRPNGCGLMAFVRTAHWYYTRHDSGSCEPGKWCVGIHGREWGQWGDMLQSSQAVVDDFGNLVRVQ